MSRAPEEDEWSVSINNEESGEESNNDSELFLPNAEKEEEGNSWGGRDKKWFYSNPLEENEEDEDDEYKEAMRIQALWLNKLALVHTSYPYFFTIKDEGVENESDIEDGELEGNNLLSLFSDKKDQCLELDKLNIYKIENFKDLVDKNKISQVLKEYNLVKEFAIRNKDLDLMQKVLSPYLSSLDLFLSRKLECKENLRVNMEVILKYHGLISTLEEVYHIRNPSSSILPKTRSKATKIIEHSPQGQKRFKIEGEGDIVHNSLQIHKKSSKLLQLPGTKPAQSLSKLKQNLPAFNMQNTGILSEYILKGKQLPTITIDTISTDINKFKKSKNTQIKEINEEAEETEFYREQLGAIRERKEDKLKRKREYKESKLEEAKKGYEQYQRNIDYKIMKNKGLTRKRKKIERNSRVKLRNKYNKAVIRRKANVQDCKGKIDYYGGEATGINYRSIKSTRL